MACPILHVYSENNADIFVDDKIAHVIHSCDGSVFELVALEIFTDVDGVKWKWSLESNSFEVVT